MVELLEFAKLIHDIFILIFWLYLMMYRPFKGPKFEYLPGLRPCPAQGGLLRLPDEIGTSYAC